MIPLCTTTMRPSAISMWVGVLLGRTRPCIGPSGVADAVHRPSTGSSRMASSRLASLPADRRRAMPSGLTSATPASRRPRYSMRQSVQQHRHDRLRPDVSDDSAHIQIPTFFRATSCRTSLPSLGPALDVVLPATSDSQRSGRDVRHDRRSCAHVRPYPQSPARLTVNRSR